MPQNDWQFEFSGDPSSALEATQSIQGIHGRQLVSLQELIQTFTECSPEATYVSVVAGEQVAAKSAGIQQTVTLNSIIPGQVLYSDHGIPSEVKARLGQHQEITKLLRWSGRNACDEVILTTSHYMKIQLSQRPLPGGSTVCTCNYSFTIS